MAINCWTHPTPDKLHVSKQRLFSALMLAGVFAVSVGVRLPQLRGPIRFRHELWLTSLFLRNFEIWEQGGISAYHYAPVMTYPGETNKRINTQGSLTLQLDHRGDYYYTSYPPFSLYVVYAVAKCMHLQPSVALLRVLNLIWNFICAIFIYLTVILLMNAEGEFLPFSALMAFIVYVVTPETMWVQSSLYFCDVFAQLFFTAGIYLILRFIKKNPQSRWWSVCLAVFTFFFVYSDWSGLMFAFSVVLFATLFWKDHPAWLRAAVVSGAGGAFLVTLRQYSQIEGLRAFLDFATHKYLNRSGFGQEVSFSVHPWSSRGWVMLFHNYVEGFLPDLALLACLLLLSWKRVLGLPKLVQPALFFLAVLPVILHHLAFFNFTAVHDFSVLKTAPIIAIVAGLLVARIWGKNSEAAENVLPRSIVLGSLALFCAWGVAGYIALMGPSFPHYEKIGSFIAQNARPDEIAYIEYPREFFVKDNDGWEEPYPATILYAHRNIALWTGEESARRLARLDGVPRAVVFMMSADGHCVTGVRRLSF